MNNYYPNLDWLKILSCVGVVAIHTRPFENICFSVGFSNICPIFVAIFFICSSILLWGKLTFDEKDGFVLKKFVKRMISLYAVWNIILSPFWIHTLLKDFSNTWILHLPLEFFLNGGTYGSWFILSLVYGFLLCYLLNRFLNRYFVSIIIGLVGLYYSLVHYNGMTDFVGIYWDSDYIVAPYYSPLRALFWVELAYILNRINLSNVFVMSRTYSHMLFPGLIIYIILSTLNCLPNIQFLLNIIIVILLTIWALREKDNLQNYNYIPLFRNCTIIVYFVHFIFERELYKIIGFGVENFFITIILSFILSLIIILLSRRFTILKHLY